MPSPASFPHSGAPLLTLIPRQETAPCSQLNLLLGHGGVQRRIPAPRLYWRGWKSTVCLTSANPACASTSSSARSSWVSFGRGKQVSHRSLKEIRAASSSSSPQQGFLSPGAVTTGCLPSGSCLCSGLERHRTSHFLGVRQIPGFPWDK